MNTQYSMVRPVTGHRRTARSLTSTPRSVGAVVLRSLTPPQPGRVPWPSPKLLRWAESSPFAAAPYALPRCTSRFAPAAGGDRADPHRE